MRYFKDFEGTYKELFYKAPQDFDKTTDKEILKYCIGTLLYIPAINKKMLDNLSDLKIKDLTCVSICLEDSVGAIGEDEGIENIQDTFNKINSSIKGNIIDKNDLPLIFIRPKNVKQIDKLKKILKENLNIITGITIPKANGEKIESFIHSLDEIGCSNLYIMPIVETTEFTNEGTKTNALHVLYKSIEKNKDRILNIRMGVTDILGAYGLRRNKDLTIYDNITFQKFASDLISIFGYSDNMNIPISGGVSEFYDMKDERILNCYLREIDIDKLNGFMGKTVIHPIQMNVVQAKCAVSYEDFIDAENILLSANGKSGVSRGLLKNRMNEVNPHLKWAEKIVTLSKVYGVLNEGVEYSELLRF